MSAVRSRELTPSRFSRFLSTFDCCTPAILVLRALISNRDFLKPGSKGSLSLFSYNSGVLAARNASLVTPRDSAMPFGAIPSTFVHPDPGCLPQPYVPRDSCVSLCDSQSPSNRATDPQIHAAFFPIGGIIGQVSARNSAGLTLLPNSDRQRQQSWRHKTSAK